MPEWGDFARLVMTLFGIVNPIGVVPVFISLTESQTRRQRRRIANATAATVGVVLLGTLLIGEPLLRFFGISLASFRVGGGILILIMAVAMLHARYGGTRQTPEEREEADQREAVAVVPLGIPLLAGPGAITTVIIFGHQFASWQGHLAVGGAVLVVAASVLLAFYLAEPIARILGRTGINIVTRLMGLILAAIAVELIAAGLSVLLPGLA